MVHIRAKADKVFLEVCFYRYIRGKCLKNCKLKGGICGECADGQIHSIDLEQRS